MEIGKTTVVNEEMQKKRNEIIINIYQDVVDNLNSIKSTSGKKDKIRLLNKCCSCNERTNAIVRFLIDDRIVTGLDLKKIRKNRDRDVKSNHFMLSNPDIIDILDYLKKNNTGRDIDIEIVNSFLAKVKSNTEMFNIFEQIFTKTLNIGVGCKAYNKAFPDNQIYEHEIQKGNIYDSDKFNKIRSKYGNEFWLTEKVDGNRGSYCSSKDYDTDDFELISPNGRVHKGYDHVKDELKKIFGDKYFIDGELEYIDTTGSMTNDEIRQKTSSICSSDKDDKTEIGYKIFHILPIEEWEKKKFVTKYNDMRTELDKFDLSDCKYISILPVLYHGDDENMVMKTFKNQRENHKEGVIINFNSPYIQGKKDGIMKVKDIVDLDLKIIGWKNGKENTRLENVLGSIQVELVVDDKTYVVDVGGGFTDEFRKEFVESPEDYVGKISEIVATEISKNKDGGYSLSYPRFIEIRSDKSIFDKVVIDGKNFKIV